MRLVIRVVGPTVALVIGSGAVFLGFLLADAVALWGRCAGC